MENGYGGAKPKTKFVAGTDEKSGQKNGHICSKDKHRQRNPFTKSKRKKQKDDRLMNGNYEALDTIDYLTHDTDSMFDDSGIYNCNNSIFLDESECAVKEGITRLNGDSLATGLPPFMPHSNFTESELFNDFNVDLTKNDDEEEYGNDIEQFWKETYKPKKSHKADVRSCQKNEREINSRKFTMGTTKDDSELEKTLEDRKNEVVKQHEDTLREKWKRSGLALRKFLSERLGFSSNAKREKLHKQNGEDKKGEHKKDLGHSLLDRDMDKQIQHEHISLGDRQKNIQSKQTEGDKQSSQGKFVRKDSMSSETSSGKSSKSMMSRLKFSFRSRKKKKENNFLTLSDDSYPSSPVSYTSSSNNSSNGVSHDHLTSQSHAPNLSLFEEDFNENDLIITLNLEGNDAYFCDCQMCQSNRHLTPHTKNQKQEKQLGNSKHLKTSNKKNKSRRLFRKAKTKKKDYIGVLDNELSSSEDNYTNENGIALKSYHKDYARERLSSNSQDTVTPENTPPRTFATNSTSDVLTGLHYAIPYLPPRFRERIQTSRQDESDRRNNNGGTGAQDSKDADKKKCLKARPGSRLNDRNSKTQISHYDNLIGDGSLEDFSNLDKDWYHVVQGGERNLATSMNLSRSSSGRTHGEISNDSIFSRLRPESRPVTFRNNLIASIDQPLVSQSTEELSADTLKEDNCLYDFDNGDSLLEDLVERMDRVGTDEEDDKMVNGSFTVEATPDTNKQDGNKDEDSGWSPLAVSESSDEADDEFECDCEHCSLLRQQNTPRNLHDIPDLDADFESARQQRMDEMRFGAENELLLPDPYVDEDFFNINITELTSLDFMLMAESTFRLDIMLENVIQQMLAVQPELLNDHAVPPANQSTINNLATISLTEEHIERSPACPICLCPCELEEIMTSLVCSHLFHPLCIQAWLAKSGTCPVCRSPV